MRVAILDDFHAGKLSVFEAIRQLDEASGIDAQGRKLDGVVYTPAPIARSMVRMLQVKESETVLEPSCGRGVFVFALAEHLAQDRGWSWRAVARWCEQHLFAQDLDAQAVEDLGVLWSIFFAQRGVRSSLALQLRAGDALFAAWSQRHFGVTLGNPPYVRFQNLDTNYRTALQQRFATCARGNVDLYYAFMEQALQQSQRSCLIVPNSWMANASASTLRAALLPRVEAVVDFQARLVFAPVRAYVSIVLTGPLDWSHVSSPQTPASAACGPDAPDAPGSQEQGQQAKAATSESGTKPSPRSKRGAKSASQSTADTVEGWAQRAAPVAFRNNLPEEGGHWNRASRAGERFTQAWRLGVEEAQADTGATLEQIAQVLGGIATLCDKAFTWPDAQVINPPHSLQAGSAKACAEELATQAWVQHVDPLRGNALTQVPVQWAPRLFKLTKVSSRAELLAQTSRILCPYTAQWKIESEATLQQEAPQLLEWLHARCEVLAGRDRGDTADYEAWYAYGRRQGFFSIPAQERVLLVPIMTTGPLAPIEATVEELGGRFLIQSGYVVRAKNPADFERVREALQSERVWQHIKREGKAWAGGKDYRTFGARLLRGAPIDQCPQTAPDSA